MTNPTGNRQTRREVQQAKSRWSFTSTQSYILSLWYLQLLFGNDPPFPQLSLQAYGVVDVLRLLIFFSFHVISTLSRTSASCLCVIEFKRSLPLSALIIIDEHCSLPIHIAFFASVPMEYFLGLATWAYVQMHDQARRSFSFWGTSAVVLRVYVMRDCYSFRDSFIVLFVVNIDRPYFATTTELSWKLISNIFCCCLPDTRVILSDPLALCRPPSLLYTSSHSSPTLSH